MKRLLGITYQPTAQFPQGEKQFVLAKAAGFSRVQLSLLGDEPIIEQAALCRRVGLDVESAHLPYQSINTMWVKGEEGDLFVDRLFRCLHIISTANISLAVLHTCSGKHPPDVSQIGLDRFRAVADHAQHLGVRLAFENTRTPEHFETVVRTCCTGYHGVCWDCGHQALHTPDFHVAEQFGKHLLTVHLHDNQTAAAEEKEDQHRIPFDAKIDFEQVTAALAAARYRGTVLGEVYPYDAIYTAMRYEDFAARTYEALHRLCRMCDDKEGIL